MDERDFQTQQAINESDVLAFYDEYASDWDARFGESVSTRYFLDRRWRSFEEVLEGDAGKECALELGAGTGVYIERASRLFGRLVAVDGSPRMLERLERRIEDLALGNVSTVESNVLSLKKIPSESVDVVFFFGLIEHVVNMDSFVGEIHRVLRPRGSVIGVTPNGRSPWYLLRRSVRGTRKHCSTDRYYSRRQIEALFNRRGFLLERAVHWGAVPAGLRNAVVYRVLRFVEPILENGFLSRLLGGLTFKCRKI